MGLDITAHTQLTKTEEGESAIVLYHNISAFSGREEGIEIGVPYKSAKSFTFRAGSYGGYSEWREELAKLAGYPPAPHKDYDGKITQRHAQGAWNAMSGPFWELINFADNEGTIGPVVAKKLLADFAQFEQQSKTLDEWFADRYQHWKRAFEMAAEHGAVEFH